MTTNADFNRVINFGAGPSCLPLDVLLEAQKELLNFRGTGKSVMELSHRGAEFSKVIDETKQDLRTLLNIPNDYDILFLQGGATALFAGVPLNLCPERTDIVDFIVTGAWSKGAYQDALLYCQPKKIVDMEPQKFQTITDPSEWKFTPNASYIYYCENETVHGVEIRDAYQYMPKDAVVVCDMSSNFLSRPFDVSKYDLILAGAQKNAGIAGITIVIIKKSLLSKSKNDVPNVFNFSKKSASQSMDNTPPTFNIYITGLVLKWIIKQGGLEAMGKNTDIKSNNLYNLIDNSNGFYTIKGGDEKLEDRFFKEAQKNGITDIKGHRSVGGIRVSLYNAITIEDTNNLISFMNQFEKENNH
eukprot:gene2451-3027_t